MMMNKVSNGHSIQVMMWGDLHPRYSPIALQLSHTLCSKVCSCTICMSAKGRHLLGTILVVKTFIWEVFKLLDFVFGRVDQSSTWKKKKLLNFVMHAQLINMNCKISIVSTVYNINIYSCRPKNIYRVLCKCITHV
jgi:hypothetical protein